MITEVKWVVEGDTAIEYKTDYGKGVIPFSAMKSYWDYATADDFEGGRIYILDEKTILALLLVASNQGGVIVGWDVEKENITHISEAAYTVAVDSYAGYIYTLCIVNNFMSGSKAGISKILYGTRDAWKEGELVEGFEFNRIDEFTGDFDEIELKVDENGIAIHLNGAEYICKV